MLLKNLLRDLWRNKARFIAIVAIVAIGSAFFAGIRASCPDMKETADRYFKSSNFFDLRVTALGLTPDDVALISRVDGVRAVSPGYSVDALIEENQNEYVLKVLSLPGGSQKGSGETVNRLQVMEGRLPENDGECAVEQKVVDLTGKTVGDTLTIYNSQGRIRVKISGIIQSPLYVSRERGVSTLGKGEVNAYLYVTQSAAQSLSYRLTAIPHGVDPNLALAASLGYVTLPESTLASMQTNTPAMTLYNDLFITIEKDPSLTCYDSAYTEAVNTVKERLDELGEKLDRLLWTVETREDNTGFSEYGENADRINNIGEVFPVFFFLVAALVCLTTMTRMVEEQRVQIGTFKALGFGRFAIMSQYLIYALAASLIGGIAGVCIGFQLFPAVIVTAYAMMYSIPGLVLRFHWDLAVLAVGLSVLCTAAASLAACWKELRAAPAALMRPKAPKAGKRILFERIPILWKRFNFTWKVTMRNLFRYKQRFFMSFFGIAGCTALLLTGFGLSNSINDMLDRQFTEVFDDDMTIYMKQPFGESEVQGLKNDLFQPGDVSDTLAAYIQAIEVQSVREDGETGGEHISNVSIFVPRSETEAKTFIRYQLRGKPVPLSDSGVVLTEKLSNMLGVKTGDSIQLKLGDQTVTARVSGITENYVLHYVYMTPACYQSLFGEEVLFNQFYLNTPRDSTELAGDLLQNQKVGAIVQTSGIADGLRDSMKSIDYIVVIMIISAGLLAFVVLYNLTNINVTERQRELATIKVLGFYNGEVASYVYRENILLTLLGAFGGLVLGVLLHRYVIVTAEVDIVMFSRDIHWESYLYSALLTFLFSGIVNLVMYAKLKAINMVDSLKSIE
ncbi:MAG: ABC transporter permease [Clostridiales bacterium]|nr:ABC transporter permease [Clostridiales bacterium]